MERNDGLAADQIRDAGLLGPAIGFVSLEFEPRHRFHRITVRQDFRVVSVELVGCPGSAGQTPVAFFVEAGGDGFDGAGQQIVGHWVPEMVELAGGVDSLSRKGTDSVRVAWDEVVKWAPEVLIIAPCGVKLKESIQQASQLFCRPQWSDLPAVRQGRVYAVDANSYFARPGPRVVAGTELLAHVIHPELCQWNGPETALRRLKF
jgi:hypothetical protein